VETLAQLNQTISTEAKNLTTALQGSNKIQGNYGELVLEKVLESSGLRKGHEYHVQVSQTREDGSRVQPDVVIHLPEGRRLVVDSKISLEAYRQAVAAEEQSLREAAVKSHITSVQNHIKGLSAKNYQQLYGIESLDFVIMFVPLEPAFMMALTHERDLFMEAWNRNVLLVSPSTLLFVVRTVAHLWRQEAQSRNAQEIAERGADLYDKLSGFVKNFENLGDRLKQAQEEFDDARGKLSTGRGNLIRQAEMLRELGVKPTKSLPSKLVETSRQGEELPGSDKRPAEDPSPRS
jgi:DNA recombination protein RmuC